MTPMPPMSGADLQMLIKTAERMNSALDAHLAALDRKAKALSKEGQQIPSENNMMLYVSDPATGLLRLQQDSAYLCKGIIVVDARIASIGVQTYQVAVIDENARRDLTGGLHPLYVDPFTALPAMEDANVVPGDMFVPLSSWVGDFLVAPNVDDSDGDVQLVDFILPRAGVLRFGFLDPTAQLGPSVDAEGPFPTVVLVGYKIT